jgi:hypothetical protein
MEPFTAYPLPSVVRSESTSASGMTLGCYNVLNMCMTLGVDWMAWQVGLLGRIGKTDNRRKGEIPDVSPDQTTVELVSYVGKCREWSGERFQSLFDRVARPLLFHFVEWLIAAQNTPVHVLTPTALSLSAKQINEPPMCRSIIYARPNWWRRRRISSPVICGMSNNPPRTSHRELSGPNWALHRCEPASDGF